MHHQPTKNLTFSREESVFLLLQVKTDFRLETGDSSVASAAMVLRMLGTQKPGGFSGLFI
jgi:hypothetical protein